MCCISHFTLLVWYFYSVIEPGPPRWMCDLDLDHIHVHMGVWCFCLTNGETRAVHGCVLCSYHVMCAAAVMSLSVVWECEEETRWGSRLMTDLHLPHAHTCTHTVRHAITGLSLPLPWQHNYGSSSFSNWHMSHSTYSIWQNVCNVALKFSPPQQHTEHYCWRALILPQLNNKAAMKDG